MTLLHGCRAELGPLELIIQTTERQNGFHVSVEDPRLPHRTIFELSVLGSLESAPEYVEGEGSRYLESDRPATAVKWRCS